MASNKELKALITLAGKIDPSLQSTMMKAAKLSSNVSNSAKKSASSLSKVGQIAKGVFVGNLVTNGVEKIGDGLIETAKNGIKLASDLTEVQNVVDTTFGSSAGTINNWAQTALNGFGLSELQAKQFTGTLGAMMKSSGMAGDKLTKMSENLVGLAGDFSSFYNISQDDAFEKIRSGISGETMPLKQLGINMDIANLNAYALSKGLTKTYDKMDQASQTALRYSYLMSVSKDAQGDFAKTQGNFANQQRLLKTNFEQLASKIMNNVLPALTSGVQWANNFIGSFKPEDITSFVDKIKPYLNDAGDVVKYMYDESVDLYNFINNNWSSISPIVYGIAGAVGAYEIAMIGANIATKGGLIIEALSKAWWVATGIIGAYREGMTLAAIAQDVLNFAMEANPIGVVITLIGLAVAAGVALYENWDKVSAGLSYVWETIKSAFTSGVNWVIGKVNSLIGFLDKIPGVNIGQINKIGGAGSNASGGMDKYATGGIATQASIFGEDGPEMAIPLKRNTRNLGLLNQTAQILGVRNQGSQSSIQLTYAPVVNAADVTGVSAVLNSHKEELKAMLEDLLSEKGRVSFD